ncbi:MAG TPA: hypothetical protein VIP28_10370 [Nocardioides sp.]
MNDDPQTTETARDLLWRHGLPEDIIDGALALFAQELAGKIRARFDGSIIDDVREQDAGLISPENWARTDAAPVAAPPTEQAADFVPPAAEGLPPSALDSATDGASALNAWARDPHGRNFLAHALVQLARDGWLRQEAGETFEPMRDREPAQPAVVQADGEA